MFRKRVPNLIEVMFSIRPGVRQGPIHTRPPKWMKVIKGKPCGFGVDCINEIEAGASALNGILTLSKEMP